MPRAHLKKNILFQAWALPVITWFRRRFEYTHRQLENARLRLLCISKSEFLRDVHRALTQNTGYAAGKIGLSQKQWMYYEVLLTKNPNAQTLKRFEEDLIMHALNQEGIFPATTKFFLEFNRFYMEHVRNLDCIGIFFYPRLLEQELIKYYTLENKLIYYLHQEPDRSLPSNENNCYLQYFKNKKLLLICPFAELLKARATKETFEGVWSKIGKKWFYPSCVDALEFPYGFSTETHKRFSSVLALFDHITAEIDKKDFDVALIAAGALALPIASYIKNKGKIGIDLGGHLQVLFGVLGKRWRDLEHWKRDYFNDYWIDMPSKYRPREIDAGMRQPDHAPYW